MKYSTLQKVMLTTMALVVSLALSAQAKLPTLSSATHGKNSNGGRIAFSARQAGTGQQSPMSFIYSLDDGTAEDAIGLTAGGDVISLNSFTVIPGVETIDSVDIAWGTPAFPDPTLNGLPYTVCIWSDPNGDGNPNDAVLLTTAGGVVASQGTNTFINTPIGATITTSKFFVGFLISQSAGQFPAAFDETAPTFSNRSYIAGSLTQGGGNINNLNANDLPVAAIESFGLVGNWLIRANSPGNPSPTPTPTPTATPAGALWYNGDFDGVNGLANERDTSLGSGQYASVYDDFTVTDAAGWDVHSVFSNNLENTNVTGATWEIRQGISEGNGGSIIASGMTMTPNVTPTGRSGFGFTEFMVEVTGLDVFLGQGDYFLNVTPTGDLTGRSFDSTTVGANCIGTPCGNNQNAFFDSNFFGAFFTSTANEGQPTDFSMGVNGDVHGGGGGDLMLTSAASMQRGFAINLPLSGPSGVEDRSTLANKKMSIAMTFNNTISSVGSASSTCGGVSSISISGNVVTVNLVGVAHGCNQHDIYVTANNVMDDMGNTLSSATATVGLLLGDVNGDRVVNGADRQIVRGNKGQKTNGTNYRSDVSNNGHIESSDVQLVNQQQGTSLP